MTTQDEFALFRGTVEHIKENSDRENNSSSSKPKSEKKVLFHSKPTVLVIDDDLNVREALKITLGKKYEIVLCSNGEEGVNSVNSEVCAVILDIKMEGKNGFDTFLEIKEINAYIPILFHSAYQDIKNPFEIMNEFRPFGYIVKGEDGKRLLTTLDSAVEYYLQINKNAILLEKLKVQEEQYRTLVDNLNVGVYRNTGGSKGIFLQANPALVKILGYDSMEEFMQKTIAEFYIDPNDRQMLLNQIQTHGFCKNFEIKLKKKDETPILVSISANVKRDNHGNIEWMDGILQDITEQKEAEEYLHKLSKTYQKFVPKQFLEFLGKSDITEIQLGDQTQKEMSILFSDIRSFTSLSETMNSGENFKFINAYLKRVVPQIEKNHGFIDKYIGDAVMALFPNNPTNAIDASILMLEELHLYNEQRKKKQYKPISIGIGINTGNLTLGIVGDENRMEGTVISDVVNLASRMESLTKMYGASILISEMTFQKLEDPSIYDFRIVDTVKVKGKKEPVTVIEILNGNSKRIIELKLATKRDFEFGTTLYQEKDFTEAKHCFHRVLEKDPHDKAAEIYLKRSQYYEIHGITPDWEGIEALENK